MQTLPLAYLKRLQALPGVQTVSHATWQGSFYRESRDMLMSFAVDPTSWLATHPDMEVDAAARKRFLSDRRGLLVSRALADKYGWKVGDAVPLQSILYAAPKGDPAWTYIVSGLFETSDDGGGRNYAVTHYDYLNDGRTLWHDTVGTYVVAPVGGVSAATVSSMIDALFAHSPAPTSTTTDKAFHAEFFAQFGDVVTMIEVVIGVTFTSLILVISSGMALSVRQSSRDIGVLRVLGFSDARVYRLVIGQSAMLILTGAVVGLAIALVFNRTVTAALPQFLPSVMLPLPVALEAGGLAVLLAVLTAIVPTLIALKIKPLQAFATELG